MKIALSVGTAKHDAARTKTYSDRTIRISLISLPLGASLWFHMVQVPYDHPVVAEILCHISVSSSFSQQAEVYAYYEPVDGRPLLLDAPS